MSGMKTISLEDAKNKKNCLVELKVDGSRHTFDGQDIFSDRDIVRNDRFPHIVEELAKFNWHVRGEIAIPKGNVLQLNKKENWHKAKYYIFEIYSIGRKDLTNVSVVENREVLETIMKNGKFRNLKIPMKFKSVQQGWDFVCDKDAEGLVLKESLLQQYKLKKLFEAKVPIIGYEAGRQKGAFLIDMKGVTGRVSGTSEDYVRMYNEILKEGKVPFVEIEYPFLTEYGIPFQPRLRRMGAYQKIRVGR